MNYFDLHCDTITEAADHSYLLRRNRGHIDLLRAKQAFACYAQAFALFCGTQSLDSPEQAHKRFCRLLDYAKMQFGENRDLLTLCKTGRDFVRAQKDGRIAAFLSVEGAELLQTQEDLDAAQRAGVRIVTLAWNHDSVYATGAVKDQTAGLKPAGRALVPELERRGMFLDVSHLSDAGFWEVMELAKRPVLATHSNSRALCQHPRNLTDRQFRALCARGGLVGINLYAAFLRHDGETPTLDDVLRHIDRFMELGGEKHLCIGADFDGCQAFPEGIRRGTDICLLEQALERKGYPKMVIRDLFYDNAARFVKAHFD